jgi:hypothetical protein
MRIKQGLDVVCEIELSSLHTQPSHLHDRVVDVRMIKNARQRQWRIERIADGQELDHGAMDSRRVKRAG